MKHPVNTHAFQGFMNSGRDDENGNKTTITDLNLLKLLFQDEI